MIFSSLKTVIGFPFLIFILMSASTISLSVDANSSKKRGVLFGSTGTAGPTQSSDQEKSLFSVLPLTGYIPEESYPDRVVGYLSTGCTATLISAKLVLTAAHCVFNLGNKEWSSPITFIPGANGISNHPYGEFKVLAAYLSPTNHNFALLELNSPVGNAIGTHGISYDESSKSSFYGRLRGYPSNFDSQNPAITSCPIKKDLDKNVFAYQCDTISGMSGAPISRKLANGEETIVGVHIGYNTESMQNEGIMITEEIFNTLSKAIKNNDLSDWSKHNF